MRQTQEAPEALARALALEKTGMRILYLSSSGCLGGAETSLLGLLEGLRRLQPQWLLKLVMADDGPLASRAAELGVTSEVLPFPTQLETLGGGSGIWQMWNALVAVRRILRYRRELAELIRDFAPEVIHTNGLKMHLLAASLPATHVGRSRLICHMHDYVRTRAIARWLLRLSMRRFAGVVANSRSVAADLSESCAPARKVTQIYNGIQLCRFSPNGPKLDLDRLSGLPAAPADVIRVGLVATFAKWKGHLTFFRALARLPKDLNVRAYVIGGPVYRTAGSQYSFAELREAALRETENDRNGAAVGFVGVVSDSAAAFRALDIVVHASTDPEPFGMTIAEAMACCKPVVVSSAGGAKEIFENGVTALAHDPGDAPMLAKQIERLAREPELRQSLAESGRAAVARRFDAAITAVRFADLYRQHATAKGPVRETASEANGKCFVSV